MYSIDEIERLVEESSIDSIKFHTVHCIDIIRQLLAERKEREKLVEGYGKLLDGYMEDHLNNPISQAECRLRQKAEYEIIPKLHEVIARLESENKELIGDLDFTHKRTKVIADMLGITVHKSPSVTGTILGIIRREVEKLLAERKEIRRQAFEEAEQIIERTAETIIGPSIHDFVTALRSKAEEGK